MEKKDNTKEWKQEIIDTEVRFQKMLEDKGMHDAFVTFADDNAVLIRGTDIIKGKEAIDNFYKNKNSKGLSWKVDFVEVSKSGDLAYTYGKYIFNYKDSIGNPLKDTGVFNSIWKRQTDGTWKYVKD